MKIGIAGHISTDSIGHLLEDDPRILPSGYFGAPLLGTLIEALLDKGHDVTAFTTSNDMELSDSTVVAKGKRLKISYIPVRRRAFRYENGVWGRGVDLFKIERERLRQAIVDENPEIIHAHWSYEFAMSALASGLPHLITCHDAPLVVLKYHPSLYRLARYLMSRSVFAEAKNLTAVSPYLKNKLQPVAKTEIAVVPNPLPLKYDSTYEGVKIKNENRPIISMVLNGWGRRKNPQPAFYAFAQVRKTIPSAQLIVMGSDYEPGGQAENWAIARNLADGVNFLGPSPYKTVLRNLNQSDLLLHPALEETFCMSAVEAMALGVPVVGGENSGAIPWVVGDAGIITDVRDEKALASAILKILENQELKLQLAKKAKSSAKSRFEANIVADEYLSIYRSIIADH